MPLERENDLFCNIAEQAANFIILVHDVADQGRILYANDAACKHFGVDKATLLSWTPYNFDMRCDEALLEQLLSRMRAGEAMTFESEHCMASGELIPVEVILHPFEQGGKTLGVSYIHDIRERRKTEAQRLQYEAAIARQEVEEHYRVLVETLPDFIVRLDTQARYVYVNPSMLQGIGREEDALLGKTAMEAGITGNPESDRRLHQETLRAIESAETTIYQDWVILGSRKMCFEIRHIPEQDAAGNVVSVLGIARDITEHVKVDDALRFIAQRGWSLDGEPFLSALARYIGKTLVADYAIIDRLADDGKAETVAIFAKGEMLRNMCYSLKGTPCENVMGGEICCYSQGVQQRFPEDKMLIDMGVESYIGLPLWDSAGNVIGLITVMDSQPIADEATATGLLQLVATRASAELERERSEQQLKAREREYRRLLDDSPDVIIRYDNYCRRRYSNAVHLRTLSKPVTIGTTPVEDWGLPTGMEVAQAYQAHLRKVLDSGMPDEWELAWSDADGNPVCFLVRGTPEFDQQGAVVGVLAVARDISARKQLEAATNAREQEFRALVENSPDFITRFDRHGRRIYINPCSAGLIGDKPALGTTLAEVYPMDYEPVKDYEARLQRVLDSGEEEQFVFTLPLEDGRQYCYDIRLVPEHDENGKILSVLSIGRDITERLHLEKELRQQACYDTLTGLINRRAFGERLREEIAKAGRGGGNLALLFIDLDRFKEVNDTLGHEIGDLLLSEAAQRIRLSVRKSDIVARLGGDEFVVCLPVVSGSVHVGGIAQKIIDTVTQPFVIDSHTAHISASIGIACYPCDAEHADALLSCADQAMYAAKERGRNGFSFFTRSMLEQTETRIHLANDLRDALSQQQLREQFQVYYQPIVDIATDQVVKAEALIRWHHPVRGMVPPDQFIPVAEDTGIIHELGDWVFHEAVNMVLLWREQSCSEGVQVSVNISPRQFMHGQHIVRWLDYLTSIGLPGACLAIEITEGLLLDDQDGIKDKLTKFREAGTKVALDDFGTGYSAMAYLKKFNIDYLKIDRSFIRDLTIDESDRAIAETIVVMAKRLGMKAIAEGVETAEQRDMLATVGCEYAQGYLYSPAIPADEFLEYVADHKAIERLKEVSL